MTGSIFRKLLLQLFTLFALLLVILAVYVSLGRQLIPLVARYQPELEQRLSAELDIPIAVSAVRGGWNEFNPSVTLDGVEATVEESTSSGIDIERAVQIGSMTLELNAFRSLLRRQLVLETVNIAGSEFDLVEQANGSWQLAGITPDGAFALDAARVFDLASRFGNLELTQTRINFHFRSGEAQSLFDGRLHFQSRGVQHFLHLDALWGGGETVSLSAELFGNRVDALSGLVHLVLPENDYSVLLNGVMAQSAGHMFGRAELWAEIAGGGLSSLQAQLDLSSLGLPVHETILEVSDLAGSIMVQKADSDTADRRWPAYDLHMQNLSFLWQQERWESGSISLQNTQQGFDIFADSANVALLAAGLQQIRQLPASAQESLVALAPRGTFHNLLLSTSWDETQLLSAALQTNAVLSWSALQGAPAMWDASGYAELFYDATQETVTGLAEVDARNLMFHLPRLFNEPWTFERVNGRVNLAMDLSDGVGLRLESSVIEAQSDIVEGHAQFSLEFAQAPESEPRGTLELLVGFDRANAAFKQAYLPLAPEVAPNVRRAMEWVDAAIIGGQIYDSGLIYRGSIIPGAAPADMTVQMVYQVEEGEFRFDSAWPSLEELDGTVVVENQDVDIYIESGISQGLELGVTRASVRRASGGSGNWVLVNGSATGGAAEALSYLQSIPPVQGVADSFADWRVSGDVSAGIQLSLPLAIPNAQRQVQVSAVFPGANALEIPDLDLRFSEVQGKLQYKLDSGLASEGLTALLFNGNVDVTVASSSPSAEGAATTIEIAGVTTPEALSQWQLNTSLSQALLAYASGDLNYEARYTLPHAASASAGPPSFSLSSELEQVALDLPEPLGKALGTPLPVTINISFPSEGPRIRGSIQDVVTVDLNLHDGRIRDGLLFLGPRDDSLPIRRFNRTAPGLEVLGSVDHIDYAEWQEVLNGVVSSGAVGASSLLRFTHLADVHVAELEIFGQSVHDLDMHLTVGEDLELTLNSAMIAGTLRLPVESTGFLDVDLEYLRVPGREEVAAAEVPPEQVKPDPFAAIDPRKFPRLRFEADEILLGDADYGQWKLQVDPQDDGAMFTNLRINSRGLQVGNEGSGSEFFWGYDGRNHVSHLQAPVVAGNLADVLTAFGYAPSLESQSAIFNTDIGWSGSPGAFSSLALRGGIDLQIFNGRFLQGGAAGSSALKLISILNFDALVRRLRFSDDLVRSGLAYDEINGSLLLNEGMVTIADRLQIVGPSSLFQIRGDIDLRDETIDGSLYITLPVSDNIPWLSGLAALNNLINWQLAVGVFIFDRLFSEQMDNLTSAQYLLQGPWDALEPKLNQVFTSGGGRTAPVGIVPAGEPLPSVIAPTEPQSPVSQTSGAQPAALELAVPAIPASP